jgi:serine O-acetyltransferase
MSLKNSSGQQGKILQSIIADLCIPHSYEMVYHRSNHDVPMPSVEVLSEVVELLRSAIFPGYFGNSEIRPESMTYHIGSTIDRVYLLFYEQIKRGYCFSCTENNLAAT